ncbi:MAG: DUF2752 domain-containing protein [Okeania sp. SIO2G4]|uniref:DUF2752 domain-containing protein n=1 Tax=unclassified Okeania TaxID=2634635 RepID=UPI0013BADE30|nr:MULTISPECIES: DUF2752 domain-containing protein [unclassified Okeania]NEP39021.1 DUF2752 domain-containing protein [Okeania sp. SIO2H7]NEP75557.1 DUF2752 domain-containing protein [Okeania sp. SIO2G5]NEP96693.1 DUF2752 domain-containing protein [Okeania sp. SIO2F5]NEQ94403.1 DUF2752 domain-containing protein [Okeania sp. SIO2G4]
MQKFSEFLSDKERCQRYVYLAIALLPIIGSYFLNFGLKIPFIGCPLLHYVGIPCPGWGLTRSLMAVARGDLSQAIAYHLFWPVFFVVFIIAILHIVLELINNRKIYTFYVPLIQNYYFQIFCFLVLFGYHGTRLQQLWKTG